MPSPYFALVQANSVRWFQVVTAFRHALNALPIMKCTPALAARPRWFSFGLFLCFCVAQTSHPLRGGQTVFRPEKLAEMDAAIDQAVADKKCPGGVLWLEHGGVSYH